jgi:phenylacetate-coenzyme A ligase PaaK-like adenylate-forming protein
MDRATLRRKVSSVALAHERPDYWRTTGGTTAEPLQLPAWRSEDRLTAPNTWFARNWFNVNVDDKLFLLWGHSHLLGTGITGRLNAVRRHLKDACLGYRRFSAYDLSESSLRSAGKKLLQFRPRYVLGYSAALHRLAAFNEDKRAQFRNLDLKVAIVTGESFPSPDSATRIAEVLGCPVAMEYGAVETGTIAHQRPSGEFHVFWGSYYVEGLPSTQYPDFHEIVVTALYPRLTPLIRYRIGDLISIGANSPGICVTFNRVIGRANDGIQIGADGFIHSEAFSHVMRDFDAIHGFQVVQGESTEITINYTSDSTLPEHKTRLIHQRLCRIDDRLRTVKIKRIPNIEATISGKSKRIVSYIANSTDDVT